MKKSFLLLSLGVGLAVAVLTGQGCVDIIQTTEPEDTTTTDQMTNDQDTMKNEDSADSNDNSMMDEESKIEEDSMTDLMSAGSYEAYAPDKLSQAKNGSVVLFFRASWCPTCKELDADINGHLSQIPNNLTILDVNYDNSTDLKKKYGVTYQHTLVQVDADGNQITKWSDSPTLNDLISRVQ